MLEISDSVAVTAAECHALESSVTEYPWSEKNFASSLHANHIIVVAHDNQLLRAYAIFSLAADEATLLNIAVAASHQGQGVAKQLLQKGFERLEAQGASMCFLEVRASNLPAQGLYHSIGFYEVARRGDYYPAQKGREDAVIMCLPLSSACDTFFSTP